MTPLVLLAGMNCTADLWADCGLGNTLTPVLGERSINAQVDRLLADLPPTFALCGLSLGAIVAMALVARVPERVERLCLMSTNAKGPTPAQQESWKAWADRIEASESPENLQDEILSALLSPDALAHRPDLVRRTRRMGAATRAVNLSAQLAMQGTRSDLRPALRRIQIRTLVVSGTRDTICPPESHREIVAAMPRARLISVDSGHLLPLERADVIGDVLRAWRDGDP
ncbi:alpha/beta hydrolase [Glaciihabitans sp. UYNi722]|uniref:alpha/beta fold hydrolase n=1 Tax=Glaciihabitans sp. UYNi722 TaxID=3156344 RepID=UPI00339A02EB